MFRVVICCDGRCWQEVPKTSKNTVSFAWFLSGSTNHVFPHLPGEGWDLSELFSSSSASASSSSSSSSASSSQSRSQWAQPDLHRELQIPVGTAGPQPRVADRSGHCRTSTATSRSQWALPDQSVFTDHTLAHPLNCRGGVVARLSA